MSRSRSRVNKTLVIVFLCTLAVATVAWLHKVGQSNAAQEQAAGQQASAVTPDIQVPTSPGSIHLPEGAMTQTPAVVLPVAGTSTPTALVGTTQPTTLPAPTPLSPSALNTVPELPKDATGHELPANFMAEAKAKTDAGDLLAARSILNEALLSGKLSEADADQVKASMATLADTITFSSRRFEKDPLVELYTIKNGDVLNRVSNTYRTTSELICRINGISDPRRIRAGQTIKIIKGPLHAVVNKTRFTMDIYAGSPGMEGSVYLRTYRVGLGKDDSTPTGLWRVQPGNKLKNPTYYSPRGEGVIAAGDPNNPLGKFWIGLEGVDGAAVGKESYGVHGTIHPESIGKQESMGCVRMINDDVAVVFEMLFEGKSFVRVIQ